MSPELVEGHLRFDKLSARGQSVKSVCAVKNGLLGVNVGGHDSGGGKSGARKYQARAAISGQSPADG